MLDAQAADIQFYVMKIARLQSDLAATQNELLNARLRLRSAEDYQIKYELLLKQTEQESQRYRLYEIEEQEKIDQLISLRIEERDQYWSQKITKYENEVNQRNEKSMKKLQQQFENFKKKHEKCGSKFDQQDILAFKNKKLQKEVQALEQKIEELKRESERKREQQVRDIKESISSKNKEKQENQRKIYRQKIESLERIINNLQKELIEAKSKADPARQSQIEKLKQQLVEQSKRSNQQFAKLNHGFAEKNNEIQELLTERIRIEETLIKQKKDLKEYIKTVEDKIYDLQRQHEIQLINLKQRMGKIRDEEAQGLKRQIANIQQSFKMEKESWDTVILEKDKQIERIKNKHEEETQRHKDDKAKQIKKIEQLKEKIKQIEVVRQAGETQLLLKSLKDVEAKEADFTNYENGVTFLDRQLKKTLNRVEQKNVQINKLVKQLNQFRKQSEEEVSQLKERSRKDKKYYGEKIGQLQEEIRTLNDNMRNKERQYKRREKDYESKINQILRQNSSLKDLIDEMQKDYARALQNRKAIEASYRQQREKGMTSRSDLTIVKKQKWLEMENQKNELEVIFKQKEQQLKNKFQIQIDKLRHQRDELKRENEKLKGLIQGSKLDQQENKQNKQSLYTQFHKKMATLNLEIALTKNIYEALLQAKSRKTKVYQFDRIQEEISQSQRSLEEENSFQDLNTPAFSQFPTQFPGPNLGISFNPNSR